MAHSSLFVRDLKQWLMPLVPNDAIPGCANSYRPETLNSLRSILIEIEEMSVFTAITTSISGALLDGRTNRLSPQHLASYAPSSPEVYRRQIDRILAADLPSHLILPVQAYHARMSYALRLTRAILQAGPAPSSAIHISEYQKLEEAWRHVCGTALGAISVLRETLASVRFSRPPVNNEHAEALLRSAKSGGRPCIGKDGQIEMPRWAESRAHARHVTKLAARVLIAGVAHKVQIENLSRTGLGLSGLENVTSGTRAVIEVAGFERLHGRVMWARAGRAGIQLDAILMPDHPLLIAVEQPNRPAA